MAVGPVSLPRFATARSSWAAWSGDFRCSAALKRSTSAHLAPRTRMTNSSTPRVISV